MTPQALECLERYGRDAVKFLATFPPTLTSKVADAPARAYHGTAPALSTVAVAYGDSVATTWLATQMVALAESSGARDKGDPALYFETAQTLRAEFGFLKLTEFMLAFHRLKAGKYGKFYGSFDPMFVGEALHKFCATRPAELDYYRRQMPQEAPEECVSHHPVTIRSWYVKEFFLELHDGLVDLFQQVENARNRPEFRV